MGKRQRTPNFLCCCPAQVVGSLQERGLLRKEQLVAPQEVGVLGWGVRWVWVYEVCSCFWMDG